MNCTDAIGSVVRQKGREVFSIAPGASVYEALSVMADREIGALLVMEDDRLVGMISERDYARKVILQGRSSRDTSVAEIMTPDRISVTPCETVDECMKMMTEHRVRHLPVLDRGEVVGVVSLGDLVKWVIDAQEAEIQHLHAYIAGGYPS